MTSVFVILHAFACQSYFLSYFLSINMKQQQLQQIQYCGQPSSDMLTTSFVHSGSDKKLLLPLLMNGALHSDVHAAGASNYLFFQVIRFDQHHI